MTFNDHVGSTKSYAYTRENHRQAVHTDFIPPAEEIKVKYAAGEAVPVTMHDGSTVMLRKADSEFDITDRSRTMRYLEERRVAGEVVTGLLCMNEAHQDMHEIFETAETPLTDKTFEELNPGSEALAALQSGMK